MAKLHEVLSVESDLEGNYKRVLDEATSIFKKGEHFIGFTRTLKMFDEGRKHEEEAGRETRELTTTVRAKINYIKDSIVRYFDAVAQKEATNQEAVADVVVEDQVLLSSVPATLLLGLETKLRHIRGVYEAIPTLTPGVKWEKSLTLGDDIYEQSESENAMKTEKTLKPFVLYEATKEHPAQVKELSDTVNVGMYKKTYISGMLSPKEKSDLLGRIDKLLRAVKKARQRANAQEVKKFPIGKVIMEYINGV